MHPISQQLLERLSELADGLPPVERVLIALSGGLDSVVLLHAMKQCWTRTPLVAVHVDHGLHPESRRWADAAAQLAERLGVDCILRSVSVEQTGDGPEAAAREARYRAFEALLTPADWLLTAHHREDQAETFLLNALRGSGPRGLAAMPAVRPCGAGLLLRPLLPVGRAELAAYARQAGLEWLDDPANADLGLDRNLLRHRVLPVLAERWPPAAEKLAQSATLSRSASGLLDELAAQDLERAGAAHRLSADALGALPAERRYNLLRFALRRLGLPAAPATALRRIVEELLPARPDAEPLVQWRGGEARRYRNGVYLLPSMADVEAPQDELCIGRALDLGAGLGRLRLEPGKPGIDPALAAAGFSVRFRRGGEQLKPRSGGRTRTLKGLMQEAGIVPWMRARIPLLLQGERLVAAGDLWTDCGAQVDEGYVVQWESRPPLR